MQSLDRPRAQAIRAVVDEETGGGQGPGDARGEAGEDLALRHEGAIHPARHSPYQAEWAYETGTKEEEPVDGLLFPCSFKCVD